MRARAVSCDEIEFRARRQRRKKERKGEREIRKCRDCVSIEEAFEKMKNRSMPAGPNDEF